MKTTVFIVALLVSVPVRADVFKCIVDGKSTYQAVPCKEEKHETALNIKTVDEAANLRGRAAANALEIQQAQKRLLDAQAAEAQARAMSEAANAQQEAAQAEARLRDAESYRKSVESQQQRDEAYSKYLLKKGGMSPTFGR